VQDAAKVRTKQSNSSFFVDINMMAAVDCEQTLPWVD
jgi:hypothetical protein